MARNSGNIGQSDNTNDHASTEPSFDSSKQYQECPPGDDGQTLESQDLDYSDEQELSRSLTASHFQIEFGDDVTSVMKTLDVNAPTTST